MPPKGKKTGPPEEAFLFVNEDFQTLFGGNKNPEIDRSKQSHVQRQSFARRRNGSRQRDDSARTSASPKENVVLSLTPAVDPAILRSRSESRIPYIDLPASENVWMPLPQTQTQNQQHDFFDSGLRSSPFNLDGPIWTEPEWPFSQPVPQRTYSDMFMTDMSHGFTNNVFGYMDLVTPAEYNMPPTSASSTTMLDPFSNMQVALELWVPPLMRYYTTRLMADLFPTELQVVPLHSMRHAENLHADMKSCMANPSEMYALLAASAHHWLNNHGCIDLPGVGSDDYNRVLLLLKSKALEALRIKLASGIISQNTVIAAVRTEMTDMYSEIKVPAARNYCEAAMSMIQRVGGMETFNDLQKEQLILYHLHYTLSANDPPKLDLTWDPGPLKESFEFALYKSSVEANDELPGGHMIAALQSSRIALQDNLLQTVIELVEAQQVHDWLRTQSYRGQDYKWLIQRRLAVTHRLFAVILPIPLQVETGREPQQIINLALMYCLILARVVPFGSTITTDQYLVPALKKWTGITLQKAFAASPKLLLWIATVFGIALGAWSGQQYAATKDLHEIKGFVQNAGKAACSSLRITDGTQLRRLLKKLYFVDEISHEQYASWVVEGLGVANI